MPCKSEGVMKELFYLSLGLWLLVAGCLKPLPPESIPVTVIEIKPPSPNLIREQAVEDEDASPPLKTWLSKEEVDARRLQEAIEKAASEDPCQKGDPLCEHIQPSP